MGKRKVVTIFGVRSDIIKLSPVFPVLDRLFDHVMVHSNQHYTYYMDKLFFDELKLRQPDYNLNAGSGTHAEQTSKIMLGFEKVLMKEKPDAVIVQGDINTTLAASVVASKLGIKLVHIEGGCRGFAKKEPEEINRKVADVLSDLIFAPDKQSVENLKKEGFDEASFFLSGNTSLDVCLRNSRLVPVGVPEKYGVKKGKYIVVTIHRAQNTASKERLSSIMSALEELSGFCDVIFSVHPRTAAAISKFGISIGDKVRAIEPVGYLDFLGLMKDARLILTDSAGMQEESAFLNVPCLIAYNETPWTSYVKIGKNKLVGFEKDSIVREARKLLDDDSYYDSIRKIPYDFYPDVSEKICRKISEWLG